MSHKKIFFYTVTDIIIKLCWETRYNKKSHFKTSEEVKRMLIVERRAAKGQTHTQKVLLLSLLYFFSNFYQSLLFHKKRENKTFLTRFLFKWYCYRKAKLAYFHKICWIFRHCEFFHVTSSEHFLSGISDCKYSRRQLFFL